MCRVCEKRVKCLAWMDVMENLINQCVKKENIRRKEEKSMPANRISPTWERVRALKKNLHRTQVHLLWCSNNWVQPCKNIILAFDVLYFSEDIFEGLISIAWCVDFDSSTNCLVIIGVNLSPWLAHDNHSSTARPEDSLLGAWRATLTASVQLVPPRQIAWSHFPRPQTSPLFPWSTWLSTSWNPGLPLPLSCHSQTLTVSSS